LSGVSAAILLFPSAVLALDGRIELRGSHQEGRAGVEAYETDTQWQYLNLGQGVQFNDHWFLRVDAAGRRERLWGKSVAGSFSTDRKTMRPSLNLTYRDETYRVNLNGRALRQDQWRPGVPALRDEQFDLGIWATADYGWLLLDANAQEAKSIRSAANLERENLNHQAGLGARVDITANDEIRYNFSRTKQDLISFNSSSTYITNNIQYRGSHLFAGDRGNFGIFAFHNDFKQTDHVDDVVGLEYVLPAFAGYVLDDTPDYLDPLEDDPVQVAGLYDRDRTTPTEINIGDAAPVVRDYGGDYRNIILDFGDTQEMSTLILYVDKVLSFPGLMNWALYVSDSADGRDWGSPLSPADYTLTYQEMETSRRGWVVQFANPINHRRIKMVNSKLGPIQVPDLYITEFELYQTSTNSTPERESTTIRNRFEGEVGFKIVPSVRVRYSGNFDKRTYNAADRDLTGISHLGGAEWRFSNWMLSGQYDTYSLEGPTRNDTDANTKIISLSRNRDTALYGRLSWNQTIDNSFSAKYTTTSLTADVTWRIAPLLALTQKLTYGLRESQEFDEESDSWASTTEIRSKPKPNIQLDLKRTDRWVSQEFGSGFTTFNNTEINASWAIFPYLNYVGQTVYQVRDEEDWLIRNSLSWAPLPGGSMILQFHIRDHQDTRQDYLRRGGGASATWKPRPRLNLSAGVERYYEKIGAEKGYPVSYQFRGYWTF
jgi:hypothetical protein